MKRLGRLRFIVYSILTVLVLLGGARLVLSSGFAASRVSDRLAALLGVPVRVTGVDIALGGSSAVQGLQIYEADNARPDTPWATADDVQADFSAVDILNDDAMPKDVVLTRASIVLRFAEDGTFLTRLPRSSDSKQKMPKLRLENATITLQQAGREKPLVVSGVTADFSYSENTFRFEGNSSDSRWGNWTVRGSYDTAADVFRLTLHTDRAEVTAAKLTLIPFIPESVWEQVKIAEGVTPVDLDLTIRGSSPVNYKVTLKPENTRLRVSCIDLDADKASGDVVIENSIVRLTKVSGRTANGTIETEAVLDFSGENSDLKFSVLEVKKVDLQKLPDSWGMKEHQIHGKLTGVAELAVLVKTDVVETKGSGKGVVNDGIIRNVPIFAPITIKLEVKQGKIRIFPTGLGLFPGL